MTAISVIYNKNITGEEFPPVDQFRITYTRPDGRPANHIDLADINELLARALTTVNAKRRRGGIVEPEWSDGGYRIEVEREDGLPMRFEEVQACLLIDALRRLEAVEEVEVITMPRTTLIAVTELPLLGIRTWAEIVQQLDPDDDEQEVKLADREGAQLLLDAGLVDRYDGGAENQYIVPRSVAYCVFERRRGNVD